MKNRDIDTLRHIIRYCDDIAGLVDEFGNDFKIFSARYSYQLAVNMCIVQIGELAGKLSDEAKQANPAIPWQTIKDMRNFLVHNYGNVNLNQAWYTVKNEIPELKTICVQILSNN